MYIERLYCERFRNLDALEWGPHRHFNLVAGPNGQGKTNLLEAVAVAAGLRSFRTARLAECVQFGAETATLAVQLQRLGVRHDLALQIGRSGRKLFVDGKPAASAADFLGKLVAVLFTAGDLQLPHAEPETRRKYLDRVVFNHEPAHLSDLRQYERALASRNALLKQSHKSPIEPQMLDVYDTLLARYGAQVMRRRRAVVARFAPLVREVFAGIAAPGLQVDVACAERGVTAADAELEAALLHALFERRGRDLAVGHTTRGPHRDDLELQLDGRPAHLHASQGQSRALVLALKIAEIRSLEQALHEPPVLLLDDVSSELDAERNRALMSYLEALGGQVILTTTDARHIRVAAPRQIFSMHAGQLQVGPRYEGGTLAAADRVPDGITASPAGGPAGEP